jgi:hypothetical protein
LTVNVLSQNYIKIKNGSQWEESGRSAAKGKDIKKANAYSCDDRNPLPV